jgi:Cu/Ag efflux pump CusA
MEQTFGLSLAAATRRRPATSIVIVMGRRRASLGLLPAALSRDIGSDSQRPFAIAILGGLIVQLFLNVILWPTL